MPNLVSAGFWNYLREDITVALMQKRGLKMDLSTVQLPSQLAGDDEWSNHMSYLLGKIINKCLSQDAAPLTLSEWTCFKEEVERWKTSLPQSFAALSLGTSESKFPSLWFLRGWHGTCNIHIRKRLIVAKLTKLQSCRTSVLSRGPDDPPSILSD